LTVSLAWSCRITRSIGLGELYSSAAYVKGPPGVTTDCGYLSASELYSVRIYDISRNSF
jgi:hypothetical protein